MKLAIYSFLSFIATIFQSAIFQAALAQSDTGDSDPLISQGGDKAIYIGLLILVAAVLFAINALSSGLEKVLIFAFGLSGIAILVILFI